MPAGWIEITTFHVGMPTSELRVFHLISWHRVVTSALGMSPTLGFIPLFFLAAFSFVGFPTTVCRRASCRWSILGGPEVQVPISPRTNRDHLRSRPWGIGMLPHSPWVGFQAVCGFFPSLSVFLSSLVETESSHPRQPGSHRLPPSSRCRIRPSRGRTLRSRSSRIDIDTFFLPRVVSPRRSTQDTLTGQVGLLTQGLHPPILWPLLCTTTPRARVGNRPEPHANQGRIHARTCAGIGRRAKRKTKKEGRPVGHRSVSAKRST